MAMERDCFDESEDLSPDWCGLELDWLAADKAVALFDDWALIEKLLPKQWEAQAKQTHAFHNRRPDGFDSPSTLLRVMLMHLAQGTSLRVTAREAAEGGLAKVCDVAVLKRLRNCSDWFGWMTQQLVSELVTPLAYRHTQALPGHRLCLVDGSLVCGQGQKGAQWRVHFALDLPTLRCRQVEVTTNKQAESLTLFTWQPGDVVFADRGFSKARGIAHVLERQADVIVRAKLFEPCLYDEDGCKIDPLVLLRRLPEQGVGDWRVWMGDGSERLPLRLVAWKKPEEETRKAQARIRTSSLSKQKRTRPATLEIAGYVFLLTSLMEIEASTILALYRMRWQIELAFKRMKSLLQLGELKKKDPASARAWLQGKLLISCLIEKMIAVGDLFSPRGLPDETRHGARVKAPLPMAGNAMVDQPAGAGHSHAIIPVDVLCPVGRHPRQAT